MGKLVQVSNETVTSAVSTVTLTGINDNSNYIVTVRNVVPTTNERIFYIRFTNGGTAITTSNYNRALKTLLASGTFPDASDQNASEIRIEDLGNASGEIANGILHLYNFNDASEYSFANARWSISDQVNGRLLGGQGGYILESEQSCDGLEFHLESSDTFASGQFVLYKVVT